MCHHIVLWLAFKFDTIKTIVVKLFESQHILRLLFHIKTSTYLLISYTFSKQNEKNLKTFKQFFPFKYTHNITYIMWCYYLYCLHIYIFHIPFSISFEKNRNKEQNIRKNTVIFGIKWTVLNYMCSNNWTL